MSIVTKPLKVFELDSLRKFLNTFNNSSGSNNYLYLFASRATPYANNDTTPDTLVESMDEAYFRPTHEMMFGKLLNNTNFAYLATNYSWASGTVYTQYDNTDPDLFDSEFYVLSKYSPNYKVYKCLYNNGSSQSTVDPGSYPNGYASPYLSFTTSDGYIWKYMFEVPLAYYNSFNFANNYIPYFPPDFAIQGDDLSGAKNVQLASNTSIDVLVLTNSGNNYTAVANGIVQNIDSSNTFVSLQNNASSANNIYAGSDVYFKLIAGSNTFLRTITSYIAQNNTIIIDSPVSGVTPLNYTYSIAPKVTISGDGTGAKAFCNTTSGSINTLTVLERGSGYTRADVTISSNSIFGSGAAAYAIIPPAGGHGNNAATELGMRTLGINATFNGSESNTIPTNITYRTVGLILNPLNKGAIGHAYSNTTFNQTIDLTFTNPVTFNVPDVVTGSVSQNQGIVVFSNTILTTLVGDKNFVAGETLTNANGTISAVINSKQRTENLVDMTGEILYLNNINKISRTSSNNETIQIALQL